MIWLLGMGAPASRSDQIVIDGKNFPGAQIKELKNGRLHFAQTTGRQNSPWLSEVDSLYVDREGAFIDFNQAEQYLEQGAYDQAIERYRRAARRSDAFWPELIEARMLTALNRAARLTDAVRMYLRVVRGFSTGPACAARMMPDAVPPARNRAVSQCLVELEDGIEKTADADRKGMLMLLRYDMLRRIGEAPGADDQSAIMRLSIPVHARTQRVYEIKLDALGRANARDAASGLVEAADACIRNCPKPMLAEFLLFKGEVLLDAARDRDDLIRASWPFLRVVVHMAGTGEAAEGLFRAATVLERLHRPRKAMALLEECLKHPRVAASIKEQAAAALDRLRASASPG